MRRLAWLLGVALLAGCADEPPPPPPQVFAPPDYAYLSKLRLDVASVTVDDGWTPRPGTGEHIEALAPVPPLEALRRMAQDRLVAGGGPGTAVVTIEDASLISLPGQILGSFAIKLSVSSGTAESGTRTGEATASVSGTRAVTDPGNERADSYALVRKLMDDMNVELEYQVRHNLKAVMQSDVATPAPVQTQDLAPPPAR